jgi:starch phosphorylase
MAQAVGREHFFIFGLTADQIAEARRLGYDPRLHYDENAQLRRVLDAIAVGEFSPSEPERYRGLVEGLLSRDPYFLLADFASYVARQSEADELFRMPSAWAEKAIHNIAPMGWFSSDRAAREYAAHIWNVPL